MPGGSVRRVDDIAASPTFCPRFFCLSFRPSVFVILTVFFFARREDLLSRGFGHTTNGKKSIPKRVKPQRARRAQRLQRKNSRPEPRIDPRKAQRTGRRQIPAASVAYAVIAKSALPSTLHHFPLVIFVLFVANFFFQISVDLQYLPVVFWFGPKAGLGVCVFRG